MSREQEIVQSLGTFVRPGNVVSVQCLFEPDHTPRALSYCTDDLEKAARKALEFEARQPKGVYLMLNPIGPKWKGSTGFPRDPDILRRLWLPVDIDPEKDKELNASTEERHAAWNVLDSCRGLLDSYGLSGAVVGDSGNGWDVCYPIDLPNDDASRELVKAVLQELARRFDCTGGTVGVECHDAKRIWPCFGTWKRKKPPTEDRPHRLTWIVEGRPWDEGAAAFNTEILRSLPARWQAEADLRKGHSRSEPRQRDHNDFRLECARRYLAKEPPAINEQKGSNRCMHVALILCEGFAIDNERDFFDTIADWNQTCQPPWSEQELRHKFESALGKVDPAKKGYLIRNGDHIPDVDAAFRAAAKPGPANGTTTGNGQPETPAGSFTLPIPASQLVAPEAVPAVWKGYLARGSVTLLSALWKSGKTTLLTYLMRAMEHGGEFLGQEVIPGRILCVTEEHEGRWAARRDKYGLRDNVEFLIRPFAGKPRVERWIEFLAWLKGVTAQRQYDLIIFDTLANLWPVRDENDASGVQSALMPLHRAITNEALFLIHHNRKGDGTEATASRGSGALTAFVDTIIEFRRYDPENRKDRRRVLTSYGRDDDTPEEVVVELNDFHEYQVCGDRVHSRSQDILDILLSILPREAPGIPWKGIMERWPETGRKPVKQAVFQVLSDGVDGGLWRRAGDGVKGNPHTYWRPLEST